ncbi:MAG: VOC family protein [Burkholderiales bacterium]|nr:VOC family protein [Burkholderiales bacterium]
MRCEIDHLVVTAPSLQSGGDYVKALLGVAPGPGGAHPRMGTHNLLLRLGDAAFLEVLAPDPAAPHPGRPRWFGLDDAAALRAPRLSAWVARTDDLRGCPEQVLACCGAIETQTRGTREWLITIPADGRVPLGGALPMLVEWQQPRAPAGAGLPEAACTLASLGLRHPEPARVESLLARLGFAAGRITIEAGEPGLWAGIATPAGVRRLG